MNHFAFIVHVLKKIYLFKLKAYLLTCYVYILGSRKKGKLRTYVGWTKDLTTRLKEHNAGVGARSTRGRIWFILYAERYFTHSDALKREWQLKKDQKFRKRIKYLL